MIENLTLQWRRLRAPAPDGEISRRINPPLHGVLTALSHASGRRFVVHSFSDTDFVLASDAPPPAREITEAFSPSVFGSWLKAVARSAAQDGGRKQRRYLSRLRDFALGRPALFSDEPASSPDHLRAQLAETMAALPSDDRALIEGKYLRGETVAELAAHSGLTEKAVESRLGRLRRQLGETVREKLRSS